MFIVSCRNNADHDDLSFADDGGNSVTNDVTITEWKRPLRKASVKAREKFQNRINNDTV